MILALILACATTPSPATAVSESGVPVSGTQVSVVPVPGAMPSWSAPKPAVSTLANGSELWLLADDSLPMVSVRWIFPGGAGLDTAKAPGAMWMAALMMEESAGERDSMGMTKAFEVLAAQVSIDVDRQSVVVSLDVAAGRLDSALALVADQILRPAFAREDWERVQYQQILTLNQAREEGPALAKELAQQLHYGASPLGRPAQGTPEGVRVLSLESVKAAYLKQIRPGGSSVVVVGDVDPAGLAERLLSPLEGWEGRLETPAPSPEAEGSSGLFLVADPGASQTAIRVLGNGPSAKHIDRLAAQATAVIVGGSFTSRLNYLLREQKGYTYGAWASFEGERDFGSFRAGSNVRADATAAALSDMLGVFAGSTLFSPSDQQKARSQIFSDEVAHAASRSKLADFFAERIADDLRAGGWEKEMALALSATATDMQVIGEQFIADQNLTVVLAGDLQVIAPALKSAGFEFTVVEPTQ
jgi:zinc protease